MPLAASTPNGFLRSDLDCRHRRLGEVCRARDAWHGRDVAVKILPAIAASVGGERLLRRIEIVAPQAWGITVMLGLPGGLEIMLYEPRHTTAIS